MIGSLTGIVRQLDQDTLLLDVGGVGYEVHAHGRLLQRLEHGQTVTLIIETLVREDLIRLYGFADHDERTTFRLLQAVQGVGAKHAQAVLQVLPPADLYNAVAAQDATSVARAHGVGKKIAQRIVTELENKLGALAPSAGFGSGGLAPRQAASSPTASASRVTGTAGGAGENAPQVMTADVASALINLGYDGVEARRAAASVVQQAGDDAALDVLIKGALKELAPA